MKQQAQLGVTEGLGKLYSNLAACFLQQEQFSKAIQACQQALQVQLSPQESCGAPCMLCISTQLGAADPSYCGGRVKHAVLCILLVLRS